MYFRLSAALPLVKIAQIAYECFRRLTVKRTTALLRGDVVRDILAIREGYVCTVYVLRVRMSAPASTSLDNNCRRHRSTCRA